MMRGHLVSVALVILALLPAGTSQAQGSISTEGGLFLLLPIGARAVGMGQAGVASSKGSEAVWWNPAGLSAADKREVAIHHSQSILGTGDALAVVVPSELLGNVALSIDVLNYGDFPLVDTSGVQLGTIIPRNLIYAVTYASGVGERIGLGLSYKIVQLRFDCSGPCPAAASQTATTSALDFGMRARVRERWRTIAGLAIRNVGLPFQVNDSQQADPLPTRAHYGISQPIRLPAAGEADMELTIAADVVQTLKFDNFSFRLGGDLGYDGRFFLRGGYLLEQGAGDESGPSIGFGFIARNFVLDFGRVLAGLSADQGQSPTHVSLRYLF